MVPVVVCDLLRIDANPSLGCAAGYYCSRIRMYDKFYIFIFSVVQGNGTWGSAVRAEGITATILTLTVLIIFSVSP